MNELKLCSCGGTAEYRRVGDNKQYWAVFCNKCKKTPVPFDSARCTKIGARKEWNKRHK